MTQYTPIDKFTFTNIPLTGVLVPGATVGYVAEDKYISGGYIVVQTIEERDALLDKTLYTDKELKNGTPVYVAEDNLVYRYKIGEDYPDGEWFVDETADIGKIKDNIDDLQKIALNQKTEIDRNAKNIDDLQKIALNQKTEIDSKVDSVEFGQIVLDIHSRLNEKVDITVFNEEIDKKADKTEIPTSLAQLSNDETKFVSEGTLSENYYTKEEIDDKISDSDVWDVQEPTSITVGGINAGSVLSELTIKEILYRMMYKVIYPTMTEPSLFITQKEVICAASNSITLEGEAHFNRGKILLNGLFQNYRAGKADYYTVDNVQYPITTPESGNIFAFSATVDSVPLGYTDIPVIVHYGQGPQPVDSSGNEYGTPFPAGNIQGVAHVIGLTNTWTGTSQDSVYMLDNIEHPLNTQDNPEIDGIFTDTDADGDVVGGGFQLKTPEIMNEDQIATILVQSSVNITGVKVWDVIQNSWEWYNTLVEGEPTKETSTEAFRAVGTTTKEINHQIIEYTIYEYTGVPCGERWFRIYVD